MVVYFRVDSAFFYSYNLFVKIFKKLKVSRMPAETEITNDIMLKWIGYVVLIVVVTLVIIWFLKHRKKYEYKGVRNYHPSFMSLVMGQKPRRKYAKNEDRCRAILEKFYGKRFPSCRPAFLKNPLTKKNLEVDCFCKEMNIA